LINFRDAGICKDATFKLQQTFNNKAISTEIVRPKQFTVKPYM
jgi:hypothetical protein